MRVVELFSGIGAQAKALENLKNAKIIDSLEILATCDWDLNAIMAYDLIHNGPFDMTLVECFSDEEVRKKIEALSLSNNSKVPLPKNSRVKNDITFLRRLLSSILRTNNMVDITKVEGSKLPSNIDVMTYSFPCQDLSLAGNWHKNQGGIDRNANNRSSLLWQVERILNERIELKLDMPKFLLMENVSAIHNNNHIRNFKEWIKCLENMGYISSEFDLSSNNFGSPQKRKRTFMVSVYCGKSSINRSIVQKMFMDVNEENFHIKYKPIRIDSMNKILKDDYSDKRYLKEALKVNPNRTPSRLEIYDKNIHITKDTEIVPTVTTKQDRHPNSGIVEFDSHRPHKSEFRYLTPRECFLLMGFGENDYENIVNNNFVSKSKEVFNFEKLYRMAGNSISVNILESVFQFINDINNKIS